MHVKDFLVTYLCLSSSRSLRPFLKMIKRQTLIRHLVIDCRAELIRIIMDQANQIGLVNEYHSFMFTSLVCVSS